MANPLDLLSSEGLDTAKPVAGLDLLPGGSVGPFMKGLGAGVSGVKANLYGAGALLAHGAGATAAAVGATPVADIATGLEQSALEQSALQSEEAAAQTQTLEQVDWADPGSIVNHFKYLLGNAVPSLAFMAAGGGVGALAGRAVVGQAGLAAARAAGVVAPAVRAGAFLGAVAPDVALEAGGIYPEALKTGVENPALRAAGGGAAAAAFDFIPLLAAEKYLKPLGKGGFRSLAKGAVKGAPVGAVLEGTQEFAQSVVERAAAGLPLTDASAISDYTESFAGGAAPGLLFGAGIGMRRSTAAKPTTPLAPTPSVEQTAALAEPAAPTSEAAVSPVDAALAHQSELMTAHQAATEQVTTLEAQVRDTQTQRDATTAKLAELTAETKLPFDQRRAKSVILAERKAVQEQAKVLKAAADPLEEQYHAAKQTVETLTPQLEQAAQSASYQQTLATTPAELNPDIQFKEAPPASDIIETTPPVSDTTAAETAVAKVKRGLGMLVSSREAKLAPVADVRTQALEVVGKRARETTKTVGEQTRQGAVETAAVQAAQPSIKELVAAKNLKPGGQEKLTVVLTNALNDIAKVAATKPTTEEAQAHIQAEVPKALKGRVAAQDAQEVASIMSEAVGQSHTLYSKGAITAVETAQVAYSGAKVRLDDIGAEPHKPSPESRAFGSGGRAVAAPDAVARYDAEVKVYNSWRAKYSRLKKAEVAAANVLFQAKQKTIGAYYLVNEDTDAIVAGPYNTQDEAVTAQGENTQDHPVKGSVLPYAAIAEFNAGAESHAALTQTEFEELPQVAQEAAVDAYNEVMTSVGTRLRSRLTSLIGDDSNLVVQTFTAKIGEAIGAYTRVDKYKAVISMALNAKDGLSIADHEGFHYAEDKMLTRAERQILANALKEGRPVYERLMERVRQYDRENARENRTNLADEVSGTPAEARAYAFEFWRRGELQVEGALNRVFEKLRQFFEKVANLVKGLGFTSMEDIFNSLDRGQFAERKRGSRGLSETERLPLRTIIYSRVKDGVYSLRAEAADGRMVVGEGALSAASVEMIVGESTFRKIEAGAGIKLEGGWNQLTGSNLTARPGEGVTLYSAEETAAWYRSMLTEQVTALPTKAASAQGWKDQIKGLVAKGLVRQTEIDAVGLNEFLDLQQGKVSKDAVTAFLRENGVQVQDVMLGGEGSVLPKVAEYIRRNALDTPQTASDWIAFADAKEREARLYQRDGKDVLANLAFELSDEANQMAENLETPSGGQTGATKFAAQQLPGGTNYKELLLALPIDRNKAAADISEKQKQFIAERNEVEKLPRGNERAMQLQSLNAQIDALARQAGSPTMGALFKSSHYPDTPNILAHIRFNERTDAEGKRVLFIEEYQSDWSQKGRKGGFRNVEDPGLKQLRKERMVLIEKSEMLKLGHPELGPTWDALAKVNSEIKSLGGQLLDRNTVTGTIPSAPFVTKTEAWVALSLKRMIRYAAENGFDKVAWTTGEQQTDRYDLSKQISKIEMAGHLLTAFDLRGTEVIHMEVDNEDLPDIIGKDAAEKLLALPGEKIPGGPYRVRRLSGLDLKVGSEGMKTFYDKIVPNVANGILKKLGGGKVENVTLPIDTFVDSGALTPAENSRWHELNGLNNRAELNGRANKSLWEEYQALNEKRKTEQSTQELPTPQQGFTITPELARRAAEGLPLFSKGAVDTSDDGLGAVLRNLTPEQRTLYSQAAVNAEAAMDRRMAEGELERVQVMGSAAKMIQDALDHGSDNMAKVALGSLKTATLGGLGRWYQTHLATPHLVAAFSEGFKNVTEVFNTYERYRAVLLTRMLEEKIPEWYKANKLDQDAAFAALQKRNVNKYEHGSPELTELLAPLTEQQRGMFESATKMVEGFLRRDLKVDKEMFRRNLTTPGEAEKRIAERTMEVENLIKNGYMPLRRYGDHTVLVYQEKADGSRIVAAWEAFPRQTTALAAAQIYQEEIKRSGSTLKVEVGQRAKGVLDAGISIQQFLDTARRNGIPLSQMERERVVKSLSAAESQVRNKMLHREGIPGYSMDGVRVLSEFGVSSSSKIAYAEFASALDAALKGRTVVSDIIDGEPSIKIDELRGEPGATETAQDYKARNLWTKEGAMSGFHSNLANQLADYTLVPNHSGSVSRNLRAAAMIYFVGGSISSAFVNVMSIPMLLVPELSIHTGYMNSLSTTMGAWKTTWQHQAILRDVAKLKDAVAYPIPEIDSVDGLREALVTAAEDLRTMDTEIHGIMGMSRGAMFSQSRSVRKAMDVWMAPFRVTEQTNRIASFIAAYKVGQAKGMKGQELYRFTGSIVDSTQNSYMMSNRPGAARTPVGAMMMMFKSFPLFMVEAAVLMYKANPKSAVYMLLGLTAMTGVQGLPFAETIEDLIDMIAQRIFGSPFNARRAMRNTLKDASEAMVGYDLSSLFLHGLIDELTGMSVSSRIGAGDFVPGSRLGTADADQGRVLEQFLGAPYAMVKDVLSNVGALAGGAVTGDWKQTADAMRAGGPIAARNLIKGVQQLSDGYASDSKGRKLVDVNTFEGLLQLTGVASSGLAKAYEHDKISQQVKAFYVQAGADMQTNLVQAMQDGDMDKVREINDLRTAWNKQYPTMPLMPNPGSVRRALRLSGMTLSQRERMKLPRQLRWLADEGSSPEE